MGVADYHKATWGQNFVASIAGAVASITVAAPLDVIKTRIQNANFETRVHGLVVFRELVRNEGIGGLFKGLTPKVCAAAASSFFVKDGTDFVFGAVLQILVVGPKLVFSYTLAQSLIPLFAKYV